MDPDSPKMPKHLCKSEWLEDLKAKVTRKEAETQSLKRFLFGSIKKNMLLLVKDI